MGGTQIYNAWSSLRLLWGQVRDSVTDAIAEAPESLFFKPGMETVVDTLFKDVAKDLVTVSPSQRREPEAEKLRLEITHQQYGILRH